MPILVIFTGGTIGCPPPDRDGTLSVRDTQPAGKHYLIENYGNPHKIEFETMQPLNSLSENMTVSSWNILLNCLKGIDPSEYDGVIITHGTDSMAFAASMFGMLLSGIEIPVVFIGSNYHLLDKRADGHRNFADAVNFIRNSKLCGTFVIFESKVFLSTRIKQSRHFINKYDMPGDMPFGIMNRERFEFSDFSSYPMAVDFKNTALRQPLYKRLASISPCVFLIKPYVGLNYDCFSFTKEIKVVLNETYHTSAGCSETDEREYSIIEFYKRHAGRLKMYIAPFYSSLLAGDESPRYSSIATMLSAGIKTVSNMTVESAYAKLLLAYSLYDEDETISAFLEEPLFFEKVNI